MSAPAKEAVTLSQITTTTKPMVSVVDMSKKYLIAGGIGMLICLILSVVTLLMVADIDSKIGDAKAVTNNVHNNVTVETVTKPSYKEATIAIGANPCSGKKPIHADAAAADNYFKNQNCMVDGVVAVLEQAGANVTAGYKGQIDASSRTPITDPYWKAGLCPVNVHWHLGAEHLSVGEFDESGTGPAAASGRKLLAGSARQGFQCKHYDAQDSKFTKPYEWKHCKDMVVGQTYEVHWPHSAAGMCGTVHQYQTPFYDGVFCVGGIISLAPLNTYQKIGVHGQVFTIVNDENYYYPDMIKGMIVEGDFGKDVAKYTGSTTGTSRDNTVCSKYTPITWQVDRKCHMISASSFDKMCADMKAQRDDMTDDLHPHGSRTLVADKFAANNLVK